jgi:RNA polymerase sigma-70 factor (ECF subfamily)
MSDPDLSPTDWGTPPESWSREQWKHLGTIAARAAGRILHENEDIEGVVQEVMAALWAARGTAHPSVQAWVWTTAMNRASSWLQQKYRDRSVEERLASEADEFYRFEDDAIMKMMNDDIIQMVIERLLPQLPPRQREAIELRFLSGLDRQTIADRMGVSVDTVKTHLSRAIVQLRHHLAPSVVKGEI